MLYIHYFPDELTKVLLNYLPVIYELQDNPIDQEMINDYFRRFNGPFHSLDPRIVEVATDLIALTDKGYTITGMYSLIEKGDKITYNGVSLKLPKLLVCEEYG